MTTLESAAFLIGAALLARFLLISAAPYIKKWMDSTAETRAVELKEEFLPLPARKILVVLILSGTMIAGIVMGLTYDVRWSGISFLLPFVLSGLAVRYVRQTRRRKVVSQIPGFLDVLAGHIKAGHSFQEALSDTIPLLPKEIRKEISWIFQLCRLGTPLTEALLSWEERIPCEEIALVVRPLLVALPAGGNIVDLLNQSRDILRLRIRMKEKMQSMTAQARLQAIVLTLLPPVFVAILSKVDPMSFQQCVGTLPGKAILATAGFLLLLGWITIHKILSVDP